VKKMIHETTDYPLIGIFEQLVQLNSVIKTLLCFSLPRIFLKTGRTDWRFGYTSRIEQSTARRVFRFFGTSNKFRLPILGNI
jgi:hypothetical protein